jgi:hypothetical protein
LKGFGIDRLGKMMYNGDCVLDYSRITPWAVMGGEEQVRSVAPSLFIALQRPEHWNSIHILVSSQKVANGEKGVHAARQQNDLVLVRD